MPTVYLEGNCGIRELGAALGESGAIQSDWPALVIHVAEGAFVDVGMMAFLCAWTQGKAREGKRVHMRGDGRTNHYLARMDLHKHVGIEFDPGHRQDETGRFLPLKLIASDKDVFPTVNAICDLVLQQFDNARAFLPAMEWAVNEIVDNILIHSETPVPGAVCAQYFPRMHRLDIGICDLGKGIMASLGTSRELRGHGDAVTSALMRGVTRDPEIGQGNGMAGALEIVTQNGGGFEVWTGDVVYRFKNGKEQGFAKIPELPGTGVKFSLDTRRPVDLSATWIAGGGWSFLNVEAERLEEEGGIDVAASCTNTGTRAPAKRLRRKVRSLLPEMESRLVLDFSGVHSASSSFLDELLGRLAREYGKTVFEDRIQVVGMDPTVRKEANVVVAQRLGLDDLPEGVDLGGEPEIK